MKYKDAPANVHWSNVTHFTNSLNCVSNHRLLWNNDKMTCKKILWASMIMYWTAITLCYLGSLKSTWRQAMPKVHFRHICFKLLFSVIFGQYVRKFSWNDPVLASDYIAYYLTVAYFLVAFMMSTYFFLSSMKLHQLRLVNLFHAISFQHKPTRT